LSRHDGSPFLAGISITEHAIRYTRQPIEPLEHAGCLERTVSATVNSYGKQPDREGKQRATQECRRVSCFPELPPKEAAEIPGRLGKKECSGCHEPRSVSVAVRNTAMTGDRPLWHGPAPAAHGIHHPPELMRSRSAAHRYWSTYTATMPLLSREKLKHD
jgi:hypothetical protein